MAVALLALSIKGWLSDRSDDDARVKLVRQLRSWAGRTGGRGGRAADRLARDVARWQPRPGAWERELVALRREREELPGGPVRSAAVNAYLAQLAGAEGLVARAREPGRARRRTLRFLASEQEALAHEARLSTVEERHIIAALESARAACYRESAPPTDDRMSA